MVILGPGGAGKTMLAEGIARRTGLPIVYLDHLFWRADWEPAPRDEARRELDAATAGDRWILDGNFLPERADEDDARFARADTVVFLDVSRARCLWRVLWRLVRDHGRSRPDLPAGCREGFDVPFLRWIWRYPVVDRPRVLGLLEQIDDRTAVHHLRSRADVRRFLESL